MIFWFSGTGNSRYAAEKLSDNLSEKLVSITDALHDRRFQYRVDSRETVGFVFPVYYGGLPSVVKEFISHLRIEENLSPYIYAVITNGGNVAGCDKMLRESLDSRRLELNCVYDLCMPDNYIMMYDTTSPQEAQKYLEKAETLLEKITLLVRHRSRRGYHSTGGKRLLTSLIYPLYSHGRKTDKFYADYKCIGCGKCAGACPVGAIEMYKGKPRWVATQCVHCTACINGCPQGALQYGKHTVKRHRYIHN